MTRYSVFLCKYAIFVNLPQTAFHLPSTKQKERDLQSQLRTVENEIRKHMNIESVPSLTKLDAEMEKVEDDYNLHWHDGYEAKKESDRVTKCYLQSTRLEGNLGKYIGNE